jgi:hypothetical protein
MANFDAQVIDLVGSSWTEDQDAVNQFITEGANEVINAMPRNMLERVAEETAVTSGTTKSEGHKVLSMTRNNGTIDQPCRRIPANKRGRVADSDDMEYATATDPAYYINDGKFNILPSGGSGNKLVSVLTYSQESGTILDASDIDTIANFPNEAEYLVVLYAALKALQQAMNGKSSSLPTDVTLPTLAFPPAPVAPTISTVSYTDATNADASIESIVVPAKIDVSGNAPAFTKPSTALSLSEVSLDLFHEDLELATARLGKVQAQISEVRTNFENEKAEFDKENTRYQMEFQEEVTKVTQDLQAEVERFRTKAAIAQFNKQQDQSLNLANAAKQIEDVIADNNSKMQKYASELQRYQAEASNELQKYQAEVSSEIQNYSAKITKQVTDYQWLVSRHQNLTADYQRGLQLLTGAPASRGQ